MRIQSLLIGAAVAALVIVPALAGDQGWINGSWTTYDARNLKLDGLAATVRVDVKDSGPMAMQISGPSDRVSKVNVRQIGGMLRVESENVGGVWDWKHWFDFSHRSSGPLSIHIVVPRGTPVNVDQTAGNVTIGNTMGPLKFEVEGYTDSTVGNVSEAHLEMDGSGKLRVGNVTGKVHAETAGSGNIRLGDTGPFNADIAGSGSIAAGRINGGLKVDIAGSGDFSAASVMGPTSADIAGSGSVAIGGGEANPFRVEIMGSGSVSFDGTAVDPKISSMGSGSVRIKAYRGQLSNEGNSNLKIGG